MRTPLPPEAIQPALAALPGWHLENGQIVRTFTLPTFAQAIDFVTAAAAIAEQADHHPDIDIRYNKLRFALSTHDTGGLTKKDFTLAAELDQLQQTFPA